MSVQLTDEEFEERIEWATCAASFEELNRMVLGITNRAGQLFVEGRDADAKLFRDFARTFAARQKQLEAQLQGHIHRAKRERT